jgi:hypothetical protein
MVPLSRLLSGAEHIRSNLSGSGALIPTAATCSSSQKLLLGMFAGISVLSNQSIAPDKVHNSEEK